MQSNTKTVAGVKNNESTDKYGQRYFSATPGTSEVQALYTDSGLVQGNFRSPNAFYFTKRRVFGQRWTRLMRFSGNPSSYFDYIDSDIEGSPWSLSLNGSLYGYRSDWQPLIDDCLRSIYDKMRYGKGNAAVDLAESAETLRMLKNATSVRGLVKTFVKEVLKPKNMSASRRLKYATDKWLEYRYGWLPLVSSTYELLKTLSKKVDNGSVVVLEGRSGKQDQFAVNERKPGFLAPYSYSRTVADLSTRVLLKVRMRSRTTKELYDFTSLNPALIAWELVPLSFVADWFVNVGDCMALWEDHLLFANRFVDGFQTKTYREDVTYEFHEDWDSQPPVWPGTGIQKDGFVYSYHEFMAASRQWRTKNRTVLLSLPSPGGVRVDVNVGARRMLDAAALIRAAFGPKLR